MKLLQKSQAPVERNALFLDARIRTYCKHLRALACRKIEPVTAIRIKEGTFRTPAQADEAAQPWCAYANGALWGDADRHAMFVMEAELPEGFDEENTCLLVRGGCVHIPEGPGRWEGQPVYWDEDGKEKNIMPHLLAFWNGSIVQGMDANHFCIALPELAREGRGQIAVAAYIPRESGPSYLQFELAAIDPRLMRLYYDLTVPLDAAVCQGVSGAGAQEILAHLDRAVSEIDLMEVYSDAFYKSIARAQQYMTDVFYKTVCHPSQTRKTTAIGHTHIDVAWKWTLAQTREKVVRSYSTVLRMMEQYPEYRFMSSQPQLYEFLREEAPELYAQVQQRVAEGRWECEGAMWLEPDTNLPCGESLVRQLLYGRQFFAQEFGKTCEVLWLPDVFGYSAALPQILSKSGIRYFATAKLGWNQYNRFPYTTFHWVGLDGSSVLVQLITTQEQNDPTAETTYCGHMTVSEVIGSHQRHLQPELHTHTVMPYGHGDGGGGPTIEMVEENARMCRGIPGVPTVENGTVQGYFHELEASLAGKEVPAWKGELYFECHRGTYTSIGAVKRAHRKAEVLLRQLEQVAARDWLDGIAYPRETFRELWKVLLLNQFHDILPGSSIEPVYRDALAQLAGVQETGQRLLRERRPAPLSGDSGLTVCNPSGFPRDEAVFWETEQCGTLYRGDVPLPTQQVVRDGRRGLLFCPGEIPGGGAVSVSLGEAAAAPSGSLVIRPDHLENDWIAVDFDACGQITRLYDRRADREALADGQKGNVLTAFQDLPSMHDNWNIDVFYRKGAHPVVEDCTIEVLENGPVRGVLRIRKRFCHSWIQQDVCLYAHAPSLIFETEIDWHEQHFMLKADFPAAVWTDEMTCDIQFGNVRRPTRKNTSWDLARFEVCAHRWVDLSEPDYGVALLNDGKYGHTLNGNHLELTLLRSGTFPHPQADQGRQRFTYALLPHAGSWQQAGVDRCAAALNEPMLLTRAQAAQIPWMTVKNTNVFVESVKQSEAGDGLIVRLYENHGRSGQVSLQFDRRLLEVLLCDMMEANERLLAQNIDNFQIMCKPYEILTLKLKP